MHSGLCLSPQTYMPGSHAPRGRRAAGKGVTKDGRTREAHTHHTHTHTDRHTQKETHTHVPFDRPAVCPSIHGTYSLTSGWPPSKQRRRPVGPRLGPFLALLDLTSLLPGLLVGPSSTS
eukprot:GHVU01031994.1.p1 GENE.GHVU01031994.1~~GHVU01031994.1.p1  ORF type:complete len:119 (-),score=3.00 GHVU01031994.1:497-853(-)